MPGDIEKAKREIRWAKSTADDKRWDSLESKIQVVEAALQGVPDAEAAPLVAEIKAMREKMTAALREEKAGRILREIQRSLSAAADELNRGYDESPNLAKAIARLDSSEAREVFTADMVAKLQAEIAPIQAKQKVKTAPPKPAAAAAAAPAGSEDAQRIENDVVRTLKSGADEVARNPSSAESYVARAATRLDAADAKQHLGPDAMQRLRAQVEELRSKVSAGLKAEKAGAIEREIKRSLSAAADELNRGYSESTSLGKAIARLDSAEAHDVLSPDAIAKLQAEIAPLQAKQKGGAAPPPPPAKPAPAAAAGSEDAQRIENDVARILRSGHDDVARNPSSAESSAARAATRLDAADAKQHLGPDAMQRLRGQVEELRAKIAAAQKQEKAGAIEREIRRSLSSAADELNRGYSESTSLAKAIARLDSAEARDVLSPDTVAKLQAEIAPLQAKQKGSSAPPPPKPAATSQPTPTATPAATSAPAAPVNEAAQRIENDLKRTVGYALDELSRNPLQVENYVNRLTTRLESDDVKNNLAPETIQKYRAQVEDLRAKSDAARKDDKRQTLERFISRFIENAEEAIGYDRRQSASQLGNATARLEKDDVKELCTAESVARFKSEIARVEKLLDEANRKDALDRAHPILKELEERVAKPIFDGSAPEWRIVGDLESLNTRVRSQISDLAKDDPEVVAIEKRLAAAEAVLAKATVKLGRDQSLKRVVELWENESKAIEGWEEEKPGPAENPTYEMPKTATAARRLGWFLKDASLKEIESEYKGDKEIQAPFAEARKALDAAVAKLQSAFTALITFMEKQPRPSNRIDLEEPSRLAGRASGEFEGTAHKDANVKRAEALYTRWQAEIEAERKAKQATYDALSVEAAKAWPGILAGIKAEEGFDPQQASAKGRTFLIKELRNRIGWDFSGAYDFAIWVGETPVVGNYDKTVLAAVKAACEKTGLGLDDHTDWDAVIVAGGPGKIRQRIYITVRDRNNLELGKIEEWRPVDCVTCTVVALRAGPCAVGPKA